jgi:hypothetical protein
LIELLEAAERTFYVELSDVPVWRGCERGRDGQRIECAEGFVQGKRRATRYPTLGRAEIPTHYIFGAFLTAKRDGS